MKNLNGRRVLITGAGHGLGLMTARMFAQKGAFVLITDLDEGRVRDAVMELQSEALQVAGYTMDVSDSESVAFTRKRILREHGPIDVLVNNAGIVAGGQFLDVPLEKHLQMYQVNTHGVVIVTHAFLPDLLRRPDAHLVNIASASAFLALPNGTTYASSKWAVLGFTESIREELRTSGQSHVCVTAICPSFINTGMFNGVKAPLFTPILKPETLAANIVKCVQKRREQLLTPGFVKLIPLSKAVWPRAIFRRMLTFFGVFQAMQSWTGHRPDPKPAPESARETSEELIRVA